MKLLLTGLNHRTAPVEVRERIAFEDRALPQALDDLRRQPGLIEGMILSTCNRVEVAVTADEGADVESAVETFLADSRQVERCPGDSVSLPLRWFGSHPPFVPRGVQPGLDGGGRAADSRAIEIRVRARKRKRGAMGRLSRLGK